MIFRPAESSKKITEFYRRYLLTTFRSNNDVYNRQLKEALMQDRAIADGPYISLTDPYEKGKSLRQLVSEDVLSKEMLSLDEKAFPSDRPLYSHQELAIKKDSYGKNLVITTGTGSGKTESFLIPVLNQLLTERENGTLGSGVRTLIIYPMNALVNDQIRRLREILADMKGETKITFGRFTGETKETYKDALDKYKEIEGYDKEPSLNELISREQMRMTPPNILITNYAMLEYLLLRPGDNIIFGEDYADKWKYIVFDEAHSYNGAKGIEVSALVRRVKAMLGRKDIRFILTSATLGDEKSNDEIVRFANNLCDAYFDDSSIIRSNTVAAKPDGEMQTLDFNIYIKLADKLRNNYPHDQIYELMEKYGVSVYNRNDLAESLFYMILHDKFYLKIRSVMYKQIKTITEIANELGISSEQLTDFIAVASNAVRNNEKLFEAKYHMFLRGIEGVYVTLSPSNKLFTTRMEKYYDKPFAPSDEGFNAYQVTFCNNCGALFITGQEEEGCLKQISKQNEYYEPNVYLLEGEFEKEDADIDEKNDDKDDEQDDVFKICSICGQIKRASSVNGLTCGHGKEYENRLIRVKEKKNELHTCPCCHGFNSQRSILRPYFLGSEAATAVIATALYNELPSKEHIVSEEKIEDDFFGFGEETIKKEDEKTIAKQFLAFSDNRQTAAYFATYLENTYRDNLIKKLIYQIVKDNKAEFDEGINLSRFVKLLSSQFEKNGIHPHDINGDLKQEAWIYALKELSNYKAKNSLMRMGVIVFEVDDSEIKAPKGLMTEDEMKQVFKVLCKSMLEDAAIEAAAELSDEDAERFTARGFIRGYTQNTKKSKYVEGWEPDGNKTNKRLKYLTKVLDGNEEIARKLLKAIWTNFIIHPDKGCTEIGEVKKQKVYLLKSPKIKVVTVKKLYKCNVCKSITPYNVRGICEKSGCDGHLEEYDYKEFLKDGHYYRMLTDSSDITTMTVKEHTAQLSPDRAYEYQKEFKDKKINVLSCSTTFEMGVDVGSLETVFMRNMPPSPANYAQRAGRAGRSLRSAAYSVTYCPNSSHDLNYFKNPKTMIKGTIKPPYFNISNDKIVLRHIFASALSFFWKKYDILYTDSIGEFMEQDGFEKVKQYLDKKPEDLCKYLYSVVPLELEKLFDITGFGWVSKFYSEDKTGLCDSVVQKYEEDINKLEELKEQRHRENKSDGAVIRSINTIKDRRLIDFLSQNSLIPKYGFPVDTVELNIQPSAINQRSNLRLNRDLFAAISEYAPDSEVVADGELYTSRYVRVLSGKQWPEFYYARCDECNTLNKSLVYVDRCRQCGKPITKKNRKYIIPQFGFYAEKKVRKANAGSKPERTYKGSVSYIGDEKNITFCEYTAGNTRIHLGNSKRDYLAVLNESNFYICTTCGFSRVYDNNFAPEIKINHYDPNGYKCSSDTLKLYSIGHELQTDVVFLKFVDFNISGIDEAWTILYSMLEGLSRSLNIDRNELSGCLQWYMDAGHPAGNYGFVLFDNTPGGAGYVRQLQNPDMLAEMLSEGYRIVRNCNCGGEAADTACYSCLCNYYNQKQHDILKRRYALDFYSQLIPDYNKGITCTKGEVVSAETKKDNAENEAAASIEHYQIQFDFATGRTLNEDIWEELLDDCEGDEVNIIKQITDKNVNVSAPLYNTKAKIIESQEEFYATLAWREKHVLFFLADSIEDYEIAKRTGWSCYCTSVPFDIEEFIEKIKE